MAENNPYRLSQDNNERIFKVAIEPTEFKHLVRQNKPTAIFVGGQPGAGKTGLQDVIIPQSGLTDIVIINGDDLRSYHPNNDELLMADDTVAASFTDADVGQWIEQAIDLVVSAEANSLVEGTLRNPVTTITSANNFKTAGFKTELHVILAHEFFSRLRIFNRYLYQKREYGAGRYTLKQAHDAAYEVLPQSLNTIIESKTFDRLVLYSIERDVLLESAVLGINIRQSVGGLVRYAREDFRGSIETMLVDINREYKEARRLGCNELVLGDIEKLNTDVLAYAAKR
jgi:hypothetical protein